LVQRVNAELLGRREVVARSRSSSPSGGRVLSLQSEMELSASCSEGERSMHPVRQCEVIEEQEEMEDSDCDSREEEEEGCDEEEKELCELRQEVSSCHSQLRNMCSLLRSRERSRARAVMETESLETNSSSGSSSVNCQRVRLGQLLQVVGELEGLLQCLQGGSLRQHQGCSSCGWGVEVKQGLEVQIHRTQEQTELVSRGLKQAELEAKRQQEEVQGVKNKLALLSARLSAVESERQVLRQDKRLAGQGRDAAIRAAWKTRDEAV